MAWKIGNFVLAADIQASLSKVSPRAFQTLIALLDHPVLDRWLTAVSNQPELFAEYAILYNHFQPYYPSIEANDHPESIKMSLYDVFLQNL